MEDLPGWVISPMPGHLRDSTKMKDNTHKHTLIHPNKANVEWWWRRPNDIRGTWGPKVSWHLSDRWGKTPKNLTQETCPDLGSNPGLLCDKRACYHLLHSCGLNQWIININITITSINKLFLPNSRKLASRDLSRLSRDLAFHSQSWRISFKDWVNNFSQKSWTRWDQDAGLDDSGDL